jgi:alpha-beta hydrolase superfamily lysophospholipase
MQVPLYLGDDPDPVFGLFHAVSGAQLDTAALICPPFGWEDMCSYRARREWALRLAEDGYPTLRIDLPGSGDSGGSPREEGRVDAWTQAVVTAARWLRSRDGVQRVALIGIGLGGLLALNAAAADVTVDDLVLWSVPSRGRRLVREMRAFSQMESSQLDGAVVEGAEALGLAARPLGEEEGSLAVAGYLLTAETVRALERLDFADGSLQPTLGRALLLERDGRAVDEPLRSALERYGAEVAVAAGEGYARMMMAEPQDAVPATAVFDRVSVWLAAGAGPSLPSGTNTGTSEPVGERRTVELTLPDGSCVRESPLSLEHPFGDPFGIVTEPVGRPAAGLCVVWLNAGPQRRTGPNRMWVELARRWAVLGVPSLRLDLAGIGDAGGDGSALVDARSFFVPDYVEQVKLALDALQARGWPERVLVGGLCAGGYWAFQVAMRDERVAGALMLNPGVLVYEDGFSYALHNTQVWRKAFEAATWRRLVRGELTPSAHVRTVRVLLSGLPRRVARPLVRAFQGRRGPVDLEVIDAAFDELNAKGGRAHMIFAGEEHIHEDLERLGQLARLKRWPGISVEHIPAPLDLHTMRPLWLQHTVHDLLDRALAQELAFLGAERQNGAGAPSLGALVQRDPASGDS